MSEFMKIGIPGTTLSCATPMGTAAGQGTDMRWHAEYVVSARLRAVAVTRVLGINAARTDADLPTHKQPKIHVPHPPLERSP